MFTSTASYAAVYNDSTSLVLSSIARPGDEFEISLDVTNESDVDQNIRFTVDAPEGFRLSVRIQQVAIIQEDRNHFVATIEGPVSQTVTFGVQVLPQVLPGYYTLSLYTEALPTTSSVSLASATPTPAAAATPTPTAVPSYNAYAWGYNFYGMLGDGTTTDRSTPVQVSGLTDVAAIGGFNDLHSLALKSGGTA